MDYNSFQKIPPDSRTYSFWDQVVFWFSATSIPAAWYYGALMAGWQGIIGSLFFIIGINILSLIPWAYLGKIAAETGGSSMAIVRPAFGIRGSIIPSIFYLILGAGWAVVNVFLGAIALSFIFKAWLGFPSYLDPHNLGFMSLYIISVGIIQGIFAISGSQGLRKIHWVATGMFILLGLYQTTVVFSHWNVMSLLQWKPKQLLSYAPGLGFTFPISIAVLIDLMVAYNWTWEFIGDFSRFSKTKKAGTWGPFIGTAVSQIWWFLVGAFAVVYLAVMTNKYSPVLADPSSATVSLGLGWLAAFIVLSTTVTGNAGNLYASALGISNMISPKKAISIKTLLWIVSLVIIPLSLTPLLATSFVGFYMFFLDFLGAIVVPLWTITLIDYFFVKKQRYTDDMYKTKNGSYWYSNGWNYPAVGTLLAGTACYWICGYVLPFIRETFTTTIPTIIFVTCMYLFLTRKQKKH